MGHYTIPLDQAYAFILIFSRIGAALVWMPGFGDARVSIRIRALVGVFLSLLLVPLLKSPKMPVAPYLLEIALIQEIVIGTFVGLVGKILLSMMETAGSVISYTMGLSSAQIFDPEHGGQETLPAVFLSTIGLLMIFAMDLHHGLILSLIESFQMIPGGSVGFWQDFSTALIRLISFSFRVGIQLAAPFLIVGLVTQLAFGLVNRLMPQMQIFFVAMPLQIWGGLLILAVTMGLMVYAFGDHYASHFHSFWSLMKHG